MSNGQQSAVSSQQSAGAVLGLLPPELKAAGWKLERRVQNDDQANARWIVSNEKLQLTTAPSKILDDAIEGALILQTRSEGKKVSRAAIKSQVSSFKSQATAENGDQQTAEEVVRFPIAKIRRDGGTQPRPELDQATVDRYAEDKKNGAKFPPSVLFHDGKNYWLGRGFHRTAADEQNGEKKTDAVIRQGTQRDAILFSLGENHDHGLPRTNEQKRNAGLTMLRDPEWSGMSDSWIAEKTRTSPPFIAKLRKELNASTPNVSSSKGGSRALPVGRASAPAVRRGKDGRVRDTTKIGAKKKSEPPASASGSVGDFKVIDKRRLEQQEEVRDSKQPLIAGGTPAVPGETTGDRRPETGQAITELLKDRALLVAFNWIPGVAGVNVTVNASNDREKATRKLIGSVEVPPMPEVVIQMIAAALGEKRQPAVKKKKRAKPVGYAASKKQREAWKKNQVASKKKPAKKR